METFDKDAIQIRIVDVLKNHPTITEQGYDGDGNYQNLLINCEVFERCCLILRSIGRSKTIRKNHDSYGLKHILEKIIGGYVSNGAAICALIDCGFRIQVGDKGPNVFFNMYERDYNALSKRAEQAEHARNPRVYR